MAKPLANGFPIGALMAKDHVASPMGVGEYFVGHYRLHFHDDIETLRYTRNDIRGLAAFMRCGLSCCAASV